MTLQLNDGPTGAFFICDVRPYFGGFLAMAAIDVFLFADGHQWLGTLLFLGIAALGRATFKREAGRLGQLNILRKKLSAIGLQICDQCGYDLHGLNPMRPCPECGRTSDLTIRAMTSGDLERCLRERAISQKIMSGLSIVLGVPVTLIGPMFLGFVAWAITARWTAHLYPMSPFVWIATLVCVPLLFNTECKTGGRYFTDSVYEIGKKFPEFTPFTYSMNYAETGTSQPWVWTIANLGGITKSFVEVMLQGPRLILGGYHRLRLSGKLDSVDISRAAELLSKLNSKQSGFAPVDLMRPGEKLTDVVPAIAWLSYYGWIGVSESVDRVFLYTESRRALWDS